MGRKNDFGEVLKWIFSKSELGFGRPLRNEQNGKHQSHQPAKSS